MSNQPKLLIDRMSVDNINKLLEFNNEYPSSGQEIFDWLMKERFWINLPYKVVGELVVILNLDGYGPSEISSIFNNE